MDNLASANSDSNPNVPPSDLPAAPASLPRRIEMPTAASQPSAAEDTAGASIDHLVIVVHGAGTSRETAEEHGAELQVAYGGLCCVVLFCVVTIFAENTLLDVEAAVPL
jgi:hypothetical protein